MFKLILPLLAILPLAGPVFAKDPPTLDQAQRYLRSGSWKRAADALEKITASDPHNGMAWFELARARHSLKEYDRSVEANERAAEFPELRSTALYNLACSRALQGEMDRAMEALEAAQQAGFLDFDLLATDPDLKGLRARHGFPMPREHHYELHRGNGKSFRYHVVLPSNFDEKKTYPAAFAFPPGQGSRSADWTLENLWGGKTPEKGWIVVVPVAPDDGWWTHPFHHAMEALLSRLKRKYKIEGGKFHLVGFADGARPALTYSRMSAKYFQSLSTASAYGWSSWGDDDLRDFARRGIEVHLFAGARDEHGVRIARRVHEALENHGGRVSLTVLPDQDQRLVDLHHGNLLSRIGGSTELAHR